MSDVIPAQAVEAAAEYLPHSDDCEVRPEGECSCWQPRVNIMRAALEAAAPHLSKRQQVTTLEELEALPVGSVVLDAGGDAYQRDAECWRLAGFGDSFADHEITCPTTVLHIEATK